MYQLSRQSTLVDHNILASCCIWMVVTHEEEATVILFSARLELVTRSNWGLEKGLAILRWSALLCMVYPHPSSCSATHLTQPNISHHQLRWRRSWSFGFSKYLRINWGIMWWRQVWSAEDKTEALKTKLKRWRQSWSAEDKASASASANLRELILDNLRIFAEALASANKIQRCFKIQENTILMNC